MARITVEDCLQKVNNRFALIHLAAKRVRQLRKGAEPTIVSKNKDVVVALRELAAGTIYKYEQAEKEALLENNIDALEEELLGNGNDASEAEKESSKEKKK
jgi:DNA-directed RNA polymerase subunit omega